MQERRSRDGTEAAIGRLATHPAPVGATEVATGHLAMHLVLVERRKS